MIYVLTVLNLLILGVVVYLFYSVRHAVDNSGMRQVDDYLHELEGSVGQLTEQFERTSTKISKDLLRKTTELQALIGEAARTGPCAVAMETLSKSEPAAMDLGFQAAMEVAACRACTGDRP